MILSNTIISSNEVITVSSGDIAVSTTIDFGGVLNVSSGGITSNTIISSGGVQNIYSRGSSVLCVIEAGGTLNVDGGIVGGAFIQSVDIYGTLNINGIVNDGATILDFLEHSGSILNFNTSLGVMYDYTSEVKSGITYNLNASGAKIVQGTFTDSSVINIYSGANINNLSVTSGAAINVYNAGMGSNSFISENGILNVTDGGTVSNITINNSGMFIVNSGGFADITTINDGGTQVVGNGGITDAVTVNSGGLLTVNSGGALRGTATLNIGANATIYPDAGGAVDLVGDTNGGLVISGLENGGSATTVITIISSFNGISSGESDFITLAGIHKSNVTNVAYEDSTGTTSDDYVTLTVKNTDETTSKITLNIIGAKTAGYTLTEGANGLIYEVCFLPGSMIKTPDGEMAVEDLRIGHLVCTYDWENKQQITRPICWVGNKNITVQSDLPDDQAGYPVRVLKDSIAEGVPYKDLWVTPEHCLFFDGNFIPVRMLINGSSIYYDYSITEYTYYHIETEEHSVIWANDLLTESYLDTGNRKNFRQHGNFALFNKETTTKSWEKDASAFLTSERSYVEPIYHQLVLRAQDLGLKNDKCLELTNDSGFHLVTDTGDILQFFSQKGKQYSFLLPLNTNEVYIKSKTSRPCDVVGPFIDDRRQLGLLVGQIEIFSNNQQKLITDHFVTKDLEGWDVLEKTLCRWTNGNAKLTVSKNDQQKRILTIEILYFYPFLKENQSTSSNIKKIA